MVSKLSNDKAEEAAQEIARKLNAELLRELQLFQEYGYPVELTGAVASRVTEILNDDPGWQTGNATHC